MKTLLIISALCVGQVGNYDTAHADALRDQKPMVVGVGCAPVVGEWSVAIVKNLDGYQGPCVVVSVPEKNYLRYVTTLPLTATADDIRAVLPKVVPRVAPKMVPRERPAQKWNPATQELFQRRMNRSR